MFAGNMIRVEIHNLKGFNINNNKHLVERNIDSFFVYDSYFDFYLNNTQLITPELCVRSNFENTLFNLGETMAFSNVFYSKNVCPYVFLNSTFKYITFYQISRSFIFMNQLEFMPINKTEDLHLPNIQTLTVNVAYEHISSRLINPNIFKDVVVVYLQGYFYDIQEDLFEGFAHLKEIYILADSIEVLFGQGIEWMTHLNRDVNQSLDSSITNTSAELSRAIYLHFYDQQGKYENDLFKRVYAYPEEDICLFKKFPHRQLVFPIIGISTPIACTCTILWLVQYAEVYTNYDSVLADIINNSILMRSRTGCFQEMKCNFTERLEKCFPNQTRHHRKLGFFEKANLFLHLKLLQYIVEVFLQPFLCVLSMITNALIILTLRNKTPEKKKNLDNIMYSHIQVNAAFNMVFALIKLVSLINICIYSRTSFCSHIYKLTASQYFKIYVVFFLGNTVRFCSNCSYVCFSMSRYFLSTSNPSRFFKFFQKLNLKIFYSMVFLLSSSLSLFKIFRFKVNLFATVLSTDYPFDQYDVEHCLINKDSLDLQPARANCNLFTALNLINTISNDILFFFISIFIDLGLIRFTNQNLERKKRIFAGGDMHELNQLNQAIKLKEKVNKMIITNGLLYFLSHVPDLAITIVVLVLDKQLINSCMGEMSCVELIDIAQVFNFFPMSLQIFVFNHFDRNFRNSLDNVLDRMLLKCKKEE